MKEKKSTTNLLAIVGLGNPEPRYELTRHNLGFLIIDHLHDTLINGNINGNELTSNGNATPNIKAEKICHSMVYRFKIKKTKTEELQVRELLLVKPLTYMNKSGDAVLSLKSRFHLSQENIIIINDDVDLPFGKLRIRSNGGAGSHNGLLSIVSAIGRQFCWLRAGIANQDFKRESINNFVLARFNERELSQLSSYLSFTSKVLMSVIENGFEKTMNSYNNKFCPLEN